MSARAGVREHRIGRDKFHHKWDNSLPPVAEIDPGDVVHFETEEVTAGQLPKSDPASRLGAPHFDRLYPPGGALYVRGGGPGGAAGGGVAGGGAGGRGGGGGQTGAGRP